MTANAMEIVDLPIKQIDVSELNPRRYYDEEAGNELQRSLDERGQIYPVLVRPKEDRFELFIGSRRLLAAKARGQLSVAAIVRHDLTDQDVLELSLTENLQRTDLTPFEEGWAIIKLIKDYKLDMQIVANRIDKSESFVRRRIKLLGMPDEVQQLLSEGKLSVNHIDHLTAFKRSEEQIFYAKMIIDHRLSESDLITLIKEELETVCERRRDTAEEMSGVKISLRVKGATSLINRLSTRIKALEGDDRIQAINVLCALRNTLDVLLEELDVRE